MHDLVLGEVSVVLWHLTSGVLDRQNICYTYHVSDQTCLANIGYLFALADSKMVTVYFSSVSLCLLLGTINFSPLNSNPSGI